MANLLIVDDSGLTRSWMRAILETEGHHIAEAGNGREALTKATEDNFDLIVTDINMPELNGVELISRLRDRDADQPKILAVSAGADDLPSDIGLQAGQAIGADAILYFPCRASELVKAVGDLVSP